MNSQTDSLSFDIQDLNSELDNYDKKITQEKIEKGLINENEKPLTFDICYQNKYRDDNKIKELVRNEKQDHQQFTFIEKKNTDSDIFVNVDENSDDIQVDLDYLELSKNSNELSNDIVISEDV